jgi:hypothetical protein
VRKAPDGILFQSVPISNTDIKILRQIDNKLLRETPSTEKYPTSSFVMELAFATKVFAKAETKYFNAPLACID